MLPFSFSESQNTINPSPFPFSHATPCFALVVQGWDTSGVFDTLQSTFSEAKSFNKDIGGACFHFHFPSAKISINPRPFPFSHATPFLHLLFKGGTHRWSRLCTTRFIRPYHSTKTSEVRASISIYRAPKAHNPLPFPFPFLVQSPFLHVLVDVREATPN